MTAAIALDGVCKTFPRHASVRPRTLKEAALTRAPRRRGGRFTALDDVTFEVEAGSTVGLIGHNGAGKSTLLRLVGGVGRPDRGRVQLHGRVAALFEIGAGFHPELTGRESVVVAGVVAGLSRAEVRRRMDDIAAFAELEEFLDAPIRTYSTGMQARLAFSLAISVEPDVLLVDEILAVGDIAFQARCIERIRDLQRKGVTILLVSHDPTLVNDLCHEVVWLRGGRVIGQGPSREVTNRYRMAMAEATRQCTPSDVPDARTPAGQLLRIHENRFGNQSATCTNVQVQDLWGVPCGQIASGAGVQLSFDVRLPPQHARAQVGVVLLRSDGVICLDTSTLLTTRPGNEPQTVRLNIDRLDLAAGSYTFDVGLYSEDWASTYDYHWRAYSLRVDGPPPGPSLPLLAPPVRWARDRAHGWGGLDEQIAGSALTG